LQPTFYRAITPVPNYVGFIDFVELLSDYEYSLPEHLIAQRPLENRRDSRLLVLKKDADEVVHSSFASVVDLLQPGDALIINTSKVMKARLRGHKVSGGKVEVLLIRPLEGSKWLAFVRAKGPKTGMRVAFSTSGSATIIGPASDEEAAFIVEFDGDLSAIMESCGDLPLPPYIERPTTLEDESRYQTVYADDSATQSVAAPTAGLHFDLALLESVRAKGIEVIPVTLHVGAGTFAPVRHEDISLHQMHAEWAEVSRESAEKINAIKAKGGRIIAVGTTALRTLESASESGLVQSGGALTRLFIRPGYRFQTVDALITNFHLPKTTLLMLVSAFIGKDRLFAAYHEAIAHSYRFFSYGDACYFELRDQNE